MTKPLSEDIKSFYGTDVVIIADEYDLKNWHIKAQALEVSIKEKDKQILAMRNCYNCIHDDVINNDDFKNYCEMCGPTYKNWQYIKQND